MLRSVTVAAVLATMFAAIATAAQQVAPEFMSRPLLVRTSDGAVLQIALRRPARNVAVTVAGLRARIHRTGGRTVGLYHAFVPSRSLRAGRAYAVHVRAVSRSGGVATRDERLYLHVRWPSPRG